MALAESKRSSARWVAGLAGLAVLAIGAWLVLDASPERREGAGKGSAPANAALPGPAVAPATPTPGAQDAASGLRIAARGRLTLDREALPSKGPLVLALDLSDEARGSGDRTVRVVSEDGRRIDTTASPLAGAGSGVHLAIDPGFLSSGRYLIEVDTQDSHPLQIRRYVLELK